MFGFLRKKTKQSTISWRESKAGNLTAKDGDWRITVYAAKNPKGFAYVLSLEGVKEDDEETFFSRRFKTRDEALGPAEKVFRAAAAGGINAVEAIHGEYSDD